MFHVGSTAIPDLTGRPELDVLAVYDDAETMYTAADALVDSDEQWKRTDAAETIVVYWRDPPEAVYLKLHTPGDQKMLNQIAFRDYLRENEAPRRTYEQIKREAAAAHNEFQPYQEAKGATVRELTEDAREAGYFDSLPDQVRA